MKETGHEATPIDTVDNAEAAGPAVRSKFAGETALALLVVALLARLFMLGWPEFFIGIEELHVPSSITYAETGHFSPDNDYSGPFRKIIQYPTLKWLDDSPIGRRLPNALFGGLTVLFLYLLGKELFPKTRIGLYAGLILALDPFHISFSRTTWEDIPAAMFLTAGFYYLARALNRDSDKAYSKTLLGAAVFLALAFATRRYVGIILVALVALLVYRAWSKSARPSWSALSQRFFYLATIFGLLPLMTYLLTFYPWFARGYTLSEWVGFQAHMIGTELSGVAPELSGFGQFYGKSYQAIDWFTSLIVFGYQMSLEQSMEANLMVFNNPLSWWLAWPAVVVVGISWYRRRDQSSILLLGGFLLLYLPFLTARRQILVYSALAVLPLLYLLLARLFDLARSQPRPVIRKAAGFIAAAVLTVNVLSYPLAIAMPMPKTFSRFIPFKSAVLKAPPEYQINR